MRDARHLPRLPSEILTCGARYAFMLVTGYANGSARPNQAGEGGGAQGREIEKNALKFLLLACIASKHLEIFFVSRETRLFL